MGEWINPVQSERSILCNWWEGGGTPETVAEFRSIDILLEMICVLSFSENVSLVEIGSLDRVSLV